MGKSIKEKFRERVQRETLTEDVKVVYRVAGGMPHQRIEKELKLSGRGKADLKVRDALKPGPAEEASGELTEAETRDLLRQIASGLDSLVPRSEARFLPDSVVGSITVEVDGEETTLYFLAEEEERVAQDKSVSPQMTKALRRIGRIRPRMLKKGKEKEVSPRPPKRGDDVQ